MISVVMSCYPFTWASEGETGANTLFENFSKKVIFLVSSATPFLKISAKRLFS